MLVHCNRHETLRQHSEHRTPAASVCAVAGQIRDADLNAWLVNPIGTGMRLHAVVDARNSGSALGLEFRWRAECP